MSLNPDLIKESLRKFSSDRLNGPGLLTGGELFVSFNIILNGNEIKGTLSGEAQTAAAKRPPLLTTCGYWINLLERWAKTLVQIYKVLRQKSKLVNQLFLYRPL